MMMYVYMCLLTHVCHRQAGQVQAGQGQAGHGQAGLGGAGCMYV